MNPFDCPPGPTSSDAAAHGSGEDGSVDLRTPALRAPAPWYGHRAGAGDPGTGWRTPGTAGPRPAGGRRGGRHPPLVARPGRHLRRLAGLPTGPAGATAGSTAAFELLMSRRGVVGRTTWCCTGTVPTATPRASCGSCATTVTARCGIMDGGRAAWMAQGLPMTDQETVRPPTAYRAGTRRPQRACDAGRPAAPLASPRPGGRGRLPDDDEFAGLAAGPTAAFADLCAEARHMSRGGEPPVRRPRRRGRRAAAVHELSRHRWPVPGCARSPRHGLLPHLGPQQPGLVRAPRGPRLPARCASTTAAGRSTATCSAFRSTAPGRRAGVPQPADRPSTRCPRGLSTRGGRWLHPSGPGTWTTVTPRAKEGRRPVPEQCPVGTRTCGWSTRGVAPSGARRVAAPVYATGCRRCSGQPPRAPWSRPGGKLPAVLGEPHPLVVVVPRALPSDLPSGLAVGSGAASHAVVVLLDAAGPRSARGPARGRSSPRPTPPPEDVVAVLRAPPGVSGPAPRGRAGAVPPGHPAAPSLTVVEQAWLRRLATGGTVAGLARSCGYSEREMYRRLSAVYQRLGARTRTEALLLAERIGLLSDDT